MTCSQLYTCVERNDLWKHPHDSSILFIPLNVLIICLPVYMFGIFTFLNCFYTVQGRDVCANARTGSGKTLAYCIPALQAILSSKKSLVCISFVQLMQHLTAS